ncbi:hypothetical protein SDC9_155703 [bioreactor metagenome]|uniref:Uncharacterized protein n=1 Tax=bioreactor metagenome TaxID=1076179 RepID=A0A645F2C5_9ZZZZ
MAQTAVHQRHLEFVLEVGKCAQPPENRSGLIFFDRVDQQPVDRDRPDVGPGMAALLDHFDPFFDGEHRLFFAVDRDRHDHPVEEPPGAGDQIEVAVGQRIEAARIKYVAHDVKLL